MMKNAKRTGLKFRATRLFSLVLAAAFALLTTSCAKDSTGQTDAFGLGAQYATEEDSGKFYDYFKDTSGIQYSKK